jgi:acyl-CoA thioester hydrolase
MKTRIYYHHTDCGGVVYYANYLKFLEEARTLYFEQRGLVMQELIKKGILFVVSRQEIEYKAPAFYGDELEVRTTIVKTGFAKIEFEYEIVNQNSTLICKARSVLACVDSALKPQVIPEEIRGQLA